MTPWWLISSIPFSYSRKHRGIQASHLTALDETTTHIRFQEGVFKFPSFLGWWSGPDRMSLAKIKQRNPTIKEEENKQVEIIMFFNFLVAERNYVFAWGGGLSFKGNEGRLLVKKQFTSTSRSVSLKVTITDILIKTSSSMLVVFPLDGGETVGTI